MLKIFIILFFTIALKCGAQQNQLSFYTLFDSPMKSVMPKMNDDFGIGFSYGYQPSQSVPLVVEIDMNHSANSYKSYSKQMPFTDGSVENYKDYYKTHLNKYLLGTKWFIGREYTIFKFFITPQIGVVSFNSTLKYPNFYKAKNSSGDYPDIYKKFQRSACTVYGGQIGFELHINNLLRKTQNNDHRIQCSFSLLESFSTLKYINLRNVQDYPNESNLSPEELLIFPNNEIIYNSISTEYYKTKLKLWGIHIGYVFVF